LWPDLDIKCSRPSRFKQIKKPILTIRNSPSTKAECDENTASEETVLISPLRTRVATGFSLKAKLVRYQMVAGTDRDDILFDRKALTAGGRPTDGVLLHAL
jgi:hypothetical protein